MIKSNCATRKSKLTFEILVSLDVDFKTVPDIYICQISELHSYFWSCIYVLQGLYGKILSGFIHLVLSEFGDF